MPYGKAEDHHSEASESTASGSPSEPPMSPDLPKLMRALKPQELSANSRTSAMSPIGLNFDNDSVSLPSPPSRASGSLLSSLDYASEGRASAVSAVDIAAPPPAPKYSAPLVAAPSLPPPPSNYAGVPEPPSAPPQLLTVPAPPAFSPSWPKTALPSPSHSGTTAVSKSQSGGSTNPGERRAATGAAKPAAFAYSPPAMLPSGLPMGSIDSAAVTASMRYAGAPMLDASQRSQLPRSMHPLGTEAPQILSHMDASHSSLLTSNSALRMTGYSTGSAQASITVAIEYEIAEALTLLSTLRTGSTVEPLPPSGCYGHKPVTSYISEGLGHAAAKAAEAAAHELGHRPVKVLLPWYPTHAGFAMCDHTTPARVNLLSDNSA